MGPEVPLPDGEPPSVREVHPKLVRELVRELVALPAAEGECWPRLGVRGVRLIAPCPCRDDFRQGFATAAHDPTAAHGPGTPCRPGHHCVPHGVPERGEPALDVVDGRIVHVGVLFRPPPHDARRPAAGPAVH